MKLTFPDNASYDTVQWLFKFVVSDTVTRRWVFNGDTPIVVANDGTYQPNGPVQDISGFDAAGARLEDRRWQVTLADPQQVWYKTTLARRWRNRRADLWSRHGTTNVHRKTGYLLQRVPAASPGDGFQLTLVFGGLLDRVNSTKKLYTNKNSQRERDAADTCADYAQTEVDINWGGNL